MILSFNVGPYKNTFHLCYNVICSSYYLEKSENKTPDYSPDKPKYPVYIHQVESIDIFSLLAAYLYYSSQNNLRWYHPQGVSTKMYQTDVSAQNVFMKT